MADARPARRRRAGAIMAVALAGVLSAACSNGSVESVAAPRGLSCVDDSPACIAERQSVQQRLVADKSKGWVREPATALAYASGVRMYAFKTRKRDLTCDELSIGVREANLAAPVLRASATQGLSPAQISRGIMFADEVGKELGTEKKRRCAA